MVFAPSVLRPTNRIKTSGLRVTRGLDFGSDTEDG